MKEHLDELLEAHRSVNALFLAEADRGWDALHRAIDDDFAERAALQTWEGEGGAC